MDYLKPAGAVLDLGKSLMTIDGEKISLMGAKTDAKPVCHQVVAAATGSPDGDCYTPVIPTPRMVCLWDAHWLI